MFCLTIIIYFIRTLAVTDRDAETAHLKRVPLSTTFRLRTQPDHRPTHFHITGFAQFFNVPINPTELIVRSLPDFLNENPLIESAQVVSTNVLHVAAETARSHLTAMYSRFGRQRFQRVRSQDHKLVFVHLGVNVGLTRFHLELQAKNEASFSVPDEDGWSPLRQSIDADESDITFTRRTSLPLQALCDDLNKQGFDVAISSDAGRFVCNWVYYNSLKLAKHNSADALFVHVPPESAVPIAHQVQFIAALLNAIAMLNAPSTHSKI